MLLRNQNAKLHSERCGAFCVPESQIWTTDPGGRTVSQKTCRESPSITSPPFLSDIYVRIKDFLVVEKLPAGKTGRFVVN
jgi:hypothetical protein